MAKGINKVIIVGNACKDPEIRYTADSKAIANLSIATNEEWKDKVTGEKVSKPEFHRVVMFGKLAEIAGEYLKKGSQVYIEGRNQTREWEKDGVKRYSTEIIADQMQMLGGRPEGSTAKPQAAQAPPSQAAPSNDFDDDIPF